MLIATSVLEEQNWRVFANLPCTDWCSEVGLAHIAQWAFLRRWPSTGWAMVKWGVGSCCLWQLQGHQRWFYNHLLVMYKLTACLGFFGACGNDFVTSFKRSLMGTAYSFCLFCKWFSTLDTVVRGIPHGILPTVGWWLVPFSNLFTTCTARRRHARLYISYYV